MTNMELFDGKPVIEFNKEEDRRKFLKYAGMIGVGGALAVAGVACGGEEEDTTGSGPAAQGETPTGEPTSGPKVPSSDLDILNYALTLEYLESGFYKQGVASGILSGREQELVKAISAHEDAHVAAISGTIEDLGGQPVEEPKLNIPGSTFTDKAKFLETASAFEELGVKAYHGQVTKVKTPDILGAAAAIAGSESRHAAILATMTGGEPFPAPVEANLPMTAVLKAAKPFIKS